MAGDEVVDFEPVFDGADAVFEAFVDGHVCSYAVGEWRMASSEFQVAKGLRRVFTGRSAMRPLAAAAQRRDAAGSDGNAEQPRGVGAGDAGPRLAADVRCPPHDVR